MRSWRGPLPPCGSWGGWPRTVPTTCTRSSGRHWPRSGASTKPSRPPTAASSPSLPEGDAARYAPMDCGSGALGRGRAGPLPQALGVADRTGSDGNQPVEQHGRGGIGARRVAEKAERRADEMAAAIRPLDDQRDRLVDPADDQAGVNPALEIEE